MRELVCETHGEARGNVCGPDCKISQKQASFGSLRSNRFFTKKRLLIILSLAMILTAGSIGYVLGNGTTFTQTLPNTYIINHQSSLVTITAENYLFSANAIQLTFSASAATTDKMQISILSNGFSPCPIANSCLFQYNLAFSSGNLTATNAYLIPATVNLQSLPASTVTTITV